MALTNPKHGRPVPQYFRIAPIRATLAALTIVNWFVFAVVNTTIGGTAMETTPSTQGFVVVDHGNITHVREGVWIFSLAYTSATLLLTPAVIMLLLTTWPSRTKGLGPARFVLAVFFLAWCICCYFSVIRDTSHSLQDYRALIAR